MVDKAVYQKKNYKMVKRLYFKLIKSKFCLTLLPIGYIKFKSALKIADSGFRILYKNLRNPHWNCEFRFQMPYEKKTRIPDPKLRIRIDIPNKNIKLILNWLCIIGHDFVRLYAAWRYGKAYAYKATLSLKHSLQ